MKEKDVVATMIYESPCGVLLLGSSGGRLCLCDWLVERHHARVKRLERLLHAGFEEGASPVTEEAARQLDGYFAGKRREFDVPLLLTGTEFQKAVWNELLKIPFGETVSYGGIARRRLRRGNRNQAQAARTGGSVSSGAFPVGGTDIF